MSDPIKLSKSLNAHSKASSTGLGSTFNRLFPRCTFKNLLICLIVCACVIAPARAGGWWDGGKALEINQDNMWKTIGSKTLQQHYAVEFFGEGCGYCRQFKPDWDQLAEEFDSTDVTVATINASQLPEMGRKYGIHAYPTFVYFVPGREMFKYKFSGPRSIQTVRDWIKDCREKEEKAEQSASTNKSTIKDQEAQIKKVEEKLKNKEDVAKEELEALTLTIIQTLNHQKTLVNKLGEKVKEIKKYVMDFKAKPSQESGYLSHFMVVAVVTIIILGTLMCICKTDEEDAKTQKRRKKEKVEDNLKPLEKPKYIDEDEEILDAESHTPKHRNL